MSPSELKSSRDPGISSVLTSIQKALLSLLQPAVFFRILIPFIVSILLGLFCLFFFWQSMTDILLNLLLSIEWLNKALAWMFSFAGSDGSQVLAFLSGFLFLLMVLMAIYAIGILLASMILVPLLVPVLRRRHHPELSLHKGNNFLPSLLNNLAGLCIFLFLFALSLPLFLIPFLPVAIPLLLNSYLSQKVFPYDVLQDLASAQEIKKFQQTHRARLWILALSTGMFVYVPIINFLAPSIIALSFIFYILDNLGHFRQTQMQGEKV